MTGFGRGATEDDVRRVLVEVSSVNYRGLECACRLPKSLTGLEPKVRGLVGGRVSRGKVSVYVALDDEESQAGSLFFDEALAETVIGNLRAVAERTGISSDVRAGDLLSVPEIIRPRKEAADLDAEWSHVEPVLSKALDAFIASREAEGSRMVDALSSRTAKLAGVIGRMNAAAADQAATVRARLVERLNALVDAESLDPQRLAQEAALLADRSDVTEELTRLGAHVSQFEDALEKGGPCGTRLGFLVQEMQREANTAAAKSATQKLTDLCIEARELVEQLREQTANIE